jgi:ppGpp synthetase/RelA/SpoT-type nucleotidyltranferase
MQVYPIANGNSVDSVHSDSSMKEDAQSYFNNPSKQGYGSLHVYLHNCTLSSYLMLNNM